jgi:hypothetical protein
MYVGLISRCAASSVRNRAESRMVPDPITRSDATPGRPAIAVTIWVITSTGLVATRKIGSGAAANTAGTISAKISALRDSRSNRLSPGLWLIPAASTTRRAPSRSANSPARTRTGSAKGVASRIVARLCNRQIRVAIDKHNLRTNAAHHHGISCGGADLSGADNADFHARSSRVDVGALSPRVGGWPTRAESGCARAASPEAAEPSSELDARGPNDVGRKEKD